MPARKQILVIEGLVVCIILAGLLWWMIPEFLEAQHVKSFEGEISAGETFAKEIGRNLLFRLEPIGKGWRIWIIDKDHPETDLVGLATPPFHGVNAIYIEGWHFRNADNTGPNDGSTNAPGKMRTFFFFTTQSSYQTATPLVDKMVHPHIYAKNSDDQQQIQLDAMKAYDQLPKAAGILTIEELELSNLKKGEQAAIESMRFDVQLDWVEKPQ